MAEARQRTAQLRAEAFVNYIAEIGGIRLRPLTLATLTILQAWRNPFVLGLPGADFNAVFQFIWVHHPDYGQFAAEQRESVLQQFRASLGDKSHLAERLEESAATVRRLIDEAMHDFPGADPDSSPAPFSLHPSIVNLLMRGYDLSFAEANALMETLPLKQLVQYMRESLHRLSNGRNKLVPRSEAAVWSDYLAWCDNQPTPAAP